MNFKHKNVWLATAILLIGSITNFIITEIKPSANDSNTENEQIRYSTSVGKDDENYKGRKVFLPKDSQEKVLGEIKTGAENSERGQREGELYENGILVYVTGAVARPGLYQLANESRVGDLIARCGGFLPYAQSEQINMAQKVEDGMHLHVGFALNGNPEELLRPKQININTASAEELDTLPGVGPAVAKRILAYRQEKGNFPNIEAIKEVKGIGEGMFAKLKDKITV